MGKTKRKRMILYSLALITVLSVLLGICIVLGTVKQNYGFYGLGAVLLWIDGTAILSFIDNYRETKDMNEVEWMLSG